MYLRLKDTLLTLPFASTVKTTLDKGVTSPPPLAPPKSSVSQNRQKSSTPEYDWMPVITTVTVIIIACVVALIVAVVCYMKRIKKFTTRESLLFYVSSSIRCSR